MNGHLIKRDRRTVFASLLMGLVVGCALPNRPDKSLLSVETELDRLQVNQSVSERVSKSVEPKVVNPPAKTIRFDGKETVLGTAEVVPISSKALAIELNSLLSQEKFFTATRLIHAHPDVAEELLWERCLMPTDDRLASFVAEILSREVPASVSWTGLRTALQDDLIDGPLYHQLRTAFVKKLKTENPTDENAEQLKVVAQRLNQPLVMIDALRLLALRELVIERYAWAESLFLQAAKIAEDQGDDVREAELWLMVVTTANRSERFDSAANAWQKATQTCVDAQLNSGGSINVRFWQRAEDSRPVDATWPENTSSAMLPHCGFMDSILTSQSDRRLVLWCAVAATQYNHSEYQAALVNFKKAETFATGEDVIWLQIAQSKCLAGLGQSAAAAALLSGPTASSNPMIAIVSTAAIGSAKLQAEAFQQGMQLLGKALDDSRVTNWPGRHLAEADFALAQLILGDTSTGLDAMHAVQEAFANEGDTQSLLQALENEQRLLSHEGRDEESATVLDKIRVIESSSLRPNADGIKL